MVLNGPLGMARNDQNLLDPTCQDLFDDILDRRLIDDSSISLGIAFVSGRKRVPKPAAGITALRILYMVLSSQNEIIFQVDQLFLPPQQRSLTKEYPLLPQDHRHDGRHQRLRAKHRKGCPFRALP